MGPILVRSERRSSRTTRWRGLVLCLVLWPIAKGWGKADEPETVLAIDGPNRAIIGEPALLETRGKPPGTLRAHWLVASGQASLLALDDGTRLVFVPKTSSELLFVLILVDMERLDRVQAIGHRVQVVETVAPEPFPVPPRPPKPPPSPPTDPLQTRLREIARLAPADAILRERIAEHHRRIAAATARAVAGDPEFAALREPQAIAAQTRAAHRQILDTPALRDAWNPWFDALGTLLDAERQQGRLNEPADYARLWDRIALSLIETAKRPSFPTTPSSPDRLDRGSR